ncbi:BTB/POZ domain-containing protein At3g05675 [Silene latifolia]|uniref:BTB/POZ domain-containing protein At3g05675 n=1 Tax=Silene latifolia TaxID=37657 RepID=UPI003D77B74D
MDKQLNHNITNVTLCLTSCQSSHKFFHFDPSILRAKSNYFAHLLSLPNSASRIDIHCSSSDFNHYVDVLTHLHLPPHLLLDSWTSVTSAIGVLQVAVSLQCPEIVKSCVDYLEASPWEDKEEEEILRVVPMLGHVAMPILARLQPVDSNSTKTVFLAAVRYAMSISTPNPPFGDEIRTSAQEQIEYMLGEDDDTRLVTADEEVKSEIRIGLCRMFSMFHTELSGLLLQSDLDLETSETNILHTLLGFEWLCNVLPKMNLMREFVFKWAEISGNIQTVVEQNKFDSAMWRLKLKLIEITAKVFDAVSYGSVIVAAASKVQLLKTWLPYIQKMKPVFDTLGDEGEGMVYKMDEDLCQIIQGAIVSMIVTLPSNDQADILAGWMESQHLGYPDLTEAFEIWCYRTKSSKRRLAEGIDSVSNGSVTSDLSA